MSQPAVPLAVAEALAMIAEHPAVRTIAEPYVTDDSWVLVTITMEVSLPSRTRVAGISATGVRAIEDVNLFFPASYPLRAPTPYLRKDFPTDMPHVFPRGTGKYVWPCVYEGSLTDLLHRFGIFRVIDQVSDWLHDAAAGQLTNEAQGWEPMRRSDTDAFVRFDGDQIAALLAQNGNPLQIGAIYVIDSEMQNFLCSTSYPAVFTQVRDSAGLVSGMSSVFFAIAASKEGEPPTCNRYQPDPVTDFTSLLDLAAELHIDTVALKNTLEEWIQRTAAEQVAAGIEGDLPLSVILAARRPVPLVGGEHRTIEFIPYFLRVDRSDGQHSLEQAKVQAAYHSRTLTPQLLARVSGYDGADLNQGFLLLGCGSVGSKIASHLGRAGFGNARFVDKDYFLPHNTARNALAKKELIATSAKARMMQDLFKDLGHEHTQAFVSDAQPMLTADTPGEWTKVQPENCKLVIDATASLQLGVAEAYSAHLDEMSGSLCRAMLYAGGRAAVVVLEGKRRSPRVDDLMAELFAICRRDDQVRAALSGGSADPERVFIGDNCASFTMRMPDSVVSRASAMISTQIERWLVNGIPDAGQVCVGCADAEGIGMEWRRFEVNATEVLARRSKLWSVRVSDRVRSYIDADSSAWGPKETGGALLGRVDVATRCIIIADTVEAPPDSIREEVRFDLGVQGLKEALRRGHEDSIGYLRFIGTWHSHPDGGTHSDIDVGTLAHLVDFAGGLPMVSLVWTPSGLICAIGKKGSFGMEEILDDQVEGAVND